MRAFPLLLMLMLLLSRSSCMWELRGKAGFLICHVMSLTANRAVVISTTLHCTVLYIQYCSTIRTMHTAPCRILYNVAQQLWQRGCMRATRFHVERG